MAKLIHEIRETIGGKACTGGVCLAGPDGDQFRKLLNAEAASDTDARIPLVGAFEAESHFEAMTLFYRHHGRAEYKAGFSGDHEPDPE